ncbi:MAG TPA: CPBP family intramembrane metalloprotease [bacterium]|nr:CPBP family intramembrane metalloprotease [bacterium]
MPVYALAVKHLSLNSLIGFTGIGFTLIAAGIDAVSDSVDLWASLTGGPAAWYVPVAALPVTLLFGAGVHLFMEAIPWFQSVNRLSRSIIRQINPSPIQIVTLSLAAGWGEEILFRGAFQPVLGIVLTSVLFAGLHTGFRFDMHALRMYFLVVFLLSIGLGFLSREFGLVTAMTVHTGWDLLMLVIIRRELAHNPDTPGSQPDQGDCSGSKEQGVIQDGIDTVTER